MPFRLYRRKSLGDGFWLALSKSGVSMGRRGKRLSGSVGSGGPSASFKLVRGLSYVFRSKR